MPAATSGTATKVQVERMLIWRASLSLRVWNVSEAVGQAVALAERHGGFVEENSDGGESSARLLLRIPTQSFKGALVGIEGLGEVIHRSVQGEDVTEQYIDVEARLKNKSALRDRLMQLLDKAVNVKDVLAIETELNRVQEDIDSMEGRIKWLRGQIDCSTITLDIERRTVFGPLGYILKGLWWGVERLFVLRD
jgi:hypothetical protein